MILKLLSYNIRFGGTGRETKIAEVVQAIAHDIVVFQEATVPRVVERLAEATGLQYCAARPDHSIAYMSRIEIAHHEWYHPPGAKHSFLEIVPACCDVRIFGLHLRAMVSKWGERQRIREIRALLEGIKAHREGFHVLVGDFNSFAPGETLHTGKMPTWIRTLIWLSGRNVRREVIQIMLDGGYIDGYRTQHPEQAGYTFPTLDPHVRFDYVFVPVAFMKQLSDIQVVESSKAISASDHFPLLAHLEIENS
jgi:exodeoxyribonuclease-3